ncbi:type I polyketide synthase [Streptomyces sp. NBC_00582]|uniref:type I polyketide synthase n=1 Tax=Streptomyces sp. NBC_00582 TaxID=2975783 RepID=UPI002E804E98|nr:beta-ketoacyl synthase N-terminal-like domain-containing protein [Streptomyces sp. NBC_00582]WUB62739.1 acyltransferase domain-containing protein [Streptomyces sp. NBC_00582]
MPGAAQGAVAVVGMACRLPGAEDVDRYWALLGAGADGISRPAPDELIARGADPAYVGRENFVPAMGVIAGSRRFDHAYFSYSRAEAAATDPQQRVFLQAAVTALDDAGLDPTRFRGRIGVYAGADRVGEHLDPDLGELARYIGREKDFLATRAAYKLGLRGPALTVQTACSTSLTATHLAVRALIGGECDAALAGGVTVMPDGEWGYLYEPGGILSPDGRCRPFDEQAAGTVPSEGVAVVVLKRLTDALRDGDRIAAVITGSAVNNDGSDKMAFTAPSPAGQSEVIRAAQTVAGVDPADLDYVEAHGTATRLGDPVEVRALADVFGTAAPDRARCALGAVKGNIGHTGAASGVAGLIKTALMLEHGRLVPTAHYTRPNPLLELDGSPFRIVDRAEPWETRREDGTRVAAVSSFGVGGTNAHVVLTSAPRRAPLPERPGPRPLLVSAAAPRALGAMADALADRLDTGQRDTDRLDTGRPETGRPDAVPGTAPSVAEVSRTLAARRAHKHRAAVVAYDAEQAARLLRSVAGREAARETGAKPRRLGKVAFVLPGQGTLRHAAGAAAHRALPGFRAAFDAIGKQVRDAHGIDLTPAVDEEAGASEDWFADTVHQQLALFALGYAFGIQLKEWGVRPAVLLGNSVGEYAAAALAGVWSPQDAADVVHHRARAMADTAPGRMVSVTGDAREIAARLPADGEVTVAVEGPGTVVLSGPEGAVTDLLAGPALAGLPITPVHIRHAFHSKAMEPAAEAVRTHLSSVPARPPRLPLISNTTGDRADPDLVARPEYWATQLRSPVLLARGMETLLASGCTTYVELGPGSSMLGGLRRSAGWDAAAFTAVRLTGRPDEPAEDALLSALGTLWERGVDRALADVVEPAGPGAERVSLPGYRFQGEDPRGDRLEERLEERRGTGAPARTPAPGSPAAPARTPERAAAQTPAHTQAYTSAVAPARTPAPPSAPTPAPAPAPAAPHGPRAVLADVWCRTLGTAEARDEDDFFALGGESLMAVGLMTAVRERTGHAPSVTDFSRRPTFGDLVAAVTEGTAGAAAQARSVPGVATLAEGRPGERPLFLVSDAVGTALPYRGLAARLAAAGLGRPVLGLEDADDPRGTPRTVAALAAAHLSALRRAQPEGPYTLGGWSYGAVVAHELARLLIRRGERVDILLCLDGFVPDTAGLPLGLAPDFLRAGLRHRAEAALGVGPLARRLRGEPELRRRFAARQTALLRHRPRPLPCRAVLFKAAEGLAPGEAERLRTRLGGLYGGGLRVEPVPGDHWSMLAEPHAGPLAAGLLAVLDEKRSDHG